MAVTVTHATVATGTDAGTGEIHKAEWNAGHTVSGEIENWTLDILVASGMSSGDTNWHGSSFNDALYYGGYDYESTVGQNDEIYWDVGLSGGTWDFQLIHNTGPNRGIYTVSIDGSSIGTIDGYTASGIGAAKFTKSQITGVSITAGKRRIKLKMATKNGSSSAYFGTIQVLSFRRTA